MHDTLVDDRPSADTGGVAASRSITLDGKVAIVTGATGGFGSAISRALVGAGARVVVVGRDRARVDSVVAAIGDGAFGVHGDVDREGEPERIVDAAAAAYGRLDILVNATGGATVGGLMELDDATWRTDIEGKLLAYVRMMRACARVMRAQRVGRIVNVIGLAGREPYHLLTIPSAINAALLALTKSAADEFAADGILVNAVNPNAAETGLGDRMIADLAAAQKTTAGHIRDYLVRGTPLGRLVRPADVANAVVFYASDLAGFVTGTSLTIDGGAHRAIA